MVQGVELGVQGLGFGFRVPAKTLHKTPLKPLNLGFRNPLKLLGLRCRYHEELQGLGLRVTRIHVCKQP